MSANCLPSCRLPLTQTPRCRRTLPSGNFNDPAFRCTLEVMGRDRVYFSADYPFETMEDAAGWFDSTTVIGEIERRQIGRDNALRLFKLNEKR